MNFPCRGTWYLVPHDKLVELAGQTTNWLNTSSWQDTGLYYSTNPSPTLLEQLRPYAIEEQQKSAVTPTTRSDEVPVPLAETRNPTRRRDEPPRTNSSHWRHPNLTEAAHALTGAGYTCSPPPTESRGNYLTVRQRDGTTTITVRCPGRLHIRKEQIRTNLYIAFPDQDGIWYLVQHDELVRLAEINTPWLSADSWRVGGWYSSTNPSRQMRSALRTFALNAT